MTKRPRKTDFAELTKRVLLQSFAPASVVTDLNGNILSCMVTPANIYVWQPARRRYHRMLLNARRIVDHTGDTKMILLAMKKIS